MAEGDLITVRSEPDLREAFEHLGLRRLAAAAGPPPTLKLYLNFAPARPSRSSLGVRCGLSCPPPTPQFVLLLMVARLTRPAASPTPPSL
jgi:hypothetical protein